MSEDSSDEPLLLSADRSFITIIDPQVGFGSAHGTLGRAFGTDEIRPASEALKRIKSFLDSVPKNVPVIVVLSEYSPGMHTYGDLSDPLAYLCVPDAGADTEIAEELQVRSEWTFARKQSRDATYSTEFQRAVLDMFQIGRTKMVVCGLMTTTCVRETVISLALGHVGPTPEVFVVRELCGARASSFIPAPDLSRVDRSFSDMAIAGAKVICSSRRLVWY